MTWSESVGWLQVERRRGEERARDLLREGSEHSLRDAAQRAVEADARHAAGQTPRNYIHFIIN